ncbi:fumarate reductase subunit FrdD [Rubrivivax gelatinosus]|nr:fumarate reductase subunit FrdD [Rubrivivax gelatinosus]
MRRSHEPIFWSLFGAGGMLSALVGPALILITGVLAPLAIVLGPDALGYANMLAFVHHPLGKLVVLAVIALFLFHGCHRMLHSLHDLGVHAGRGAAVFFYGFATAGSLVCAALLFTIGF